MRTTSCARLRATTCTIPALILVLAAPCRASAAGHERPPAEAVGPSGDIAAFWHELRDWKPEAGRIATVSDVVLVRDAAEFRLEQGMLTLLDIRGKTAVAVFDGTARVKLTAPIEVERRQLRRHFGTDSLDVEATHLVFFFADSTAAELEAHASFSTQPLLRPTLDALDDALELTLGDREGQVPWSFVRSFLDGDGADLFRAHIVPRRGDDMYFSFDADSDEEVSFGRKASDGKYFETLTSFHRREDYGADGTLTSPAPDPPSIDVMEYQGTFDVTNVDEMQSALKAYLMLSEGAGRWEAASLYSTLEVDSLRWGDGSAVVYDRSPDVSTLWIRIPDPLPPGGVLELDAWYHGDVVGKTRDGFRYVEATSTWIPRFGSDDATYDLTFRARKDQPVMSVGKRVSRDVDPDDDDVVVTRWVTKWPSAQVTFSVGDFKEYEYPQGRSAPVRIDIAEDFHRRMMDVADDLARRTGGRVNIVSQANPEDKVHIDIEGSLAFFTDMYGPLDFDEYNVAEIPFYHGQAFPGMVNLSWVTFQQTQANGEDELFRAHEVAHQWWGIAVTPETYHDRWLAEGLSEFSALWYMHRARLNPQRYLDRLEELKKEIVARGTDTGPIWLGSRLAVGREGNEDYNVVVYSKGAWVLHMLRNLMLDNDTGSEAAFDGFMKALFTRFKGRTISTEAFQVFLEEYVQTDMQWFFDEWVYGTDIPTYRFAYTLENLPSGQVRMRVRVRQEDVPDDFKMIVPILLDFGSDGTAVVSVLVDGPEVEQELPLLPEKPDHVEFNVLESVLAEVHTERW